MAKRKTTPKGKLAEGSESWLFAGPETGIAPPCSLRFDKQPPFPLGPNSNQSEDIAASEDDKRRRCDVAFEDARTLIADIHEKHLGSNWDTYDSQISVLTYMHFLLSGDESPPVSEPVILRPAANPPQRIKDLRSELSPQEISQLCEAIVLRSDLVQIRRFQDEGRIEAAIYLAYRCGEAHERIRWREVEQAAAGGIRSKKGGDAVRQRQQVERRTNWKDWQAKVDELRFGKGGDWKASIKQGKKPKLSHRRAVELAAKELSVPLDTMRKRVKNRTPRRKAANDGKA